MDRHMNMHMFVRTGVRMRPYASVCVRMRPYSSEMEDDLPPLIVHIGRLLAVYLNLKRTDIPTKGRTYGQIFLQRCEDASKIIF